MDIGINDIVCDMTTKDTVIITNRKPDVTGKMIPFEAMAWRLLGCTKGRAVVGLRYVNVEGHQFQKASLKEAEGFRDMAAAKRSVYNLGFP